MTFATFYDIFKIYFERFGERMDRQQILTNINEASIQKMIPCFKPITKRYNSGDTIITYNGSNQNRIAVLESGSAKLEAINIEGDIFRLESYQAGDVFGELFTIPLSTYEYIVTAEDKCRVIYIDYAHVMAPCDHVCPHHTQLISNLFIMTAQKTQELSFHLSVLNQHSTRDKLLCYLKSIQLGKGISYGNEFEIPLTLSKLAEYLRVDRSAMTREIKAMKEEGILDSSQRTFKLLIPPAL